MILRRFYDDALAQASYLIGCDDTRQAVVVDPNRDIEQYIAGAAAEGVTIVCVTETHIHADFVSGARDLAGATGARLAVSGEGGRDWQYRLSDSRTDGGGGGPVRLSDGDELDIGNIRLRAVHTPGHTPEHLAFLVTDRASSELPVGMLSGDFIFVGDVGRPDLLERAANMAGTMERSAHELYASLQRAADLPDYLQIWPGHGAGSACGKALGSMPQTTLGYERIANPALRHADEASFVRDILSAQPEPPRYFARMKQVNRDGLPPAERAHPRRLTPEAVHAAVADGVFVVDTRPSAAFLRGFVQGTICVPNSKSFLTYFGAAAPAVCPVALLVASEVDVAGLVAWLRLIGFDDVRGWALAADVLAADGAEGAGRLSLETVALDEARRRLVDGSGALLLDVRTAGERQLGLIPGATPVALSGLDDWAASAPRDVPLIVHCQTGTRAIVGASLLRARGFTDVTPMTGGFEAWTAAGHPVVVPFST